MHLFSAEFWAILGKFKENNNSVWKFLGRVVTYGVLYVTYMSSYICFYMYWS